jgi:uncharacterized membrane protein
MITRYDGFEQILGVPNWSRTRCISGMVVWIPLLVTCTFFFFAAAFNVFGDSSGYWGAPLTLCLGMIVYKTIRGAHKRRLEIDWAAGKAKEREETRTATRDDSNQRHP